MSMVEPPLEWVGTVVDSLSGLVLELESLSREVRRLSSQLAALVSASTPPPAASPSSTAVSSRAVLDPATSASSPAPG